MTNNAVKELAAAVSLAARIEPELLRAARLRLFPDMDVSAEGDLWFSDLVASRSARRIVLDPEIVPSLRQSLQNNRPLLDAARAVVEETHRNAPPAIQLEEKIVYLALSREDVENDINTMLTSVLNAIANEGRRGLIDWAVRALPGMPAIVQNTTAAAALRLVAGGQASDALHVSRDPAIAALVGRAVPKTNVFARLVPEHDGLSVEISRTELPASHEIELPKTEPLVLELTTLGRTEVVDIPREGTLLRETDGAVSIRTIAQDVFRLEESRAEERTTVRILVMSDLSADQLALPDEPDIDLVLIAGASDRGTEEEYAWNADHLRERFAGTPILAVPGYGDPDDAAFIAFLARIGSTTDRLDFAKTVLIGTRRIGVVGINTFLGEFKGSQIIDACNGDPLAWARTHDAAILLTYDDPEDLDVESLERWNALGTGEVFDFIATGSRNTPDLADGYVVVEFPDPNGGAIVTTHTRGKDQIRRQAIHPRMEATPLAQPRRVLVAGIAEGLSVAFQELCRAIGSLLALQGHELLTGGWPGVDYLVAEGFDQATPDRVESIAHYLGGIRKESDYKRGRPVFFEREEDARGEGVRNADVVILIEGAGGTQSVGIEALSQGKPVIPIGGGAAAELRDVAIRRERWAEDTIERLRRLGGQESIATIVHYVNELIRVARPLEDPFARGRTTAQSAANRWEYDLFVSYAHERNLEWVRSFVDQLQARVSALLPQDPRFSFDEQIEQGENVPQALLDAVGASRILLIILSPKYLASPWCRMELSTFLEAAEDEAEHRIFVVEAERIERDQWPAALRDKETIAFWQEDPVTRIPERLDPVLGPEHTRMFKKRVAEIAHFIRNRLEDAPQYRGDVWIAEPTDDLVNEWEELAAAVRQSGWRVLPRSGYAHYDAVAFTAALEKDLGEAQLFVQLLGPQSGRSPQWSRLSFPELQADAARNAAKRRGVRWLRWRARGALASEHSDSYRTLIEGDVQESTPGEFAAEVIRVLNASSVIEKWPVYDVVALVYDTVDRSGAIHISEILNDYGIQTLLVDPNPDSSQSPLERRKMLSETLQTVSGVLLIYGQSPPSWIMAQFAMIRKELARRGGRVPIGLVSLPPATSSDIPIISPAVMRIDFNEPEVASAQIVRMIRGSTEAK